jgi:hypothetical protein
MKHNPYIDALSVFIIAVLSITSFQFFHTQKIENNVATQDVRGSEKQQENEFSFLEEIKPRAKVIDDCKFDTSLLPNDMVVHMVSAQGKVGKPLKYPIDGSGTQARQIDVQVNYTQNPIGLIFSATGATIWNVSWTEGTVISAIYLSGEGKFRQELIGINNTIPVIKATGYTQSTCNRFYYHPPQMTKTDLSRAAYDIFGHYLNEISTISRDTVLIGQPAPSETKFVHFPDLTVKDFLEMDQPRAGNQGIDDLLVQGKIRKAKPKDYVRWANEMFEKYKDRLSSTVPPLDHVELFWPDRPRYGYVILEKITIPAELKMPDMPLFFLEKGVPFPDVPTRKLNNKERSAVNIYDFNTLTCEGFFCVFGDKIYKDIEALEELQTDSDNSWFCGFGPDPFPEDMHIIAAGANEGKFGKFEIKINLPGHSVALILDTYKRAEWYVSWTKGTRIVAVYVMGHEEQTVKGLPSLTRVSYSSYHEGGSCDEFDITLNNLFKVSKLSQIIFKKNASKVYFAKDGKINIGSPFSDSLVFYSSKN